MSELKKVGRQEFENLIKFSMAPLQLRRVMLAYKISKYGHKGQSRESGERYFEHPKAVALILIQELKLLDPDAIIVALLHDLAEDSFLLDWMDLEMIFGGQIVCQVRALTKEPGKDYLKYLLLSETSVLMVKLADRLHNLRTLGDCRPEKRAKQIKETREKYVRVIEELEKRLSDEGLGWRAAYLRDQILKNCDEIEKSLV